MTISIEHDYIKGSLKTQSFKQWKLAQLARHVTVNPSHRVKGSIPVREGLFLLNLFCSNTK